MEKKENAAERIWNTIKDKKIDLFALPDQFVRLYCEPVNIEPSKLYLKYRVPAFLPALEEVLKNTHKVELSTKYLTVSELPVDKG